MTSELVIKVLTPLACHPELIACPERSRREGSLPSIQSAARNAKQCELFRDPVRSATSVGANCAEVDDAQPKKESLQKHGYCRKESRETKHWLRVIATAAPETTDRTRVLWQEAKELYLIFAAICRGSR